MRLAKYALCSTILPFSRRKTSLLWLKHAAQSRLPGNCYGPDRTNVSFGSWPCQNAGAGRTSRTPFFSGHHVLASYGRPARKPGHRKNRFPYVDVLSEFLQGQYQPSGSLEQASCSGLLLLHERTLRRAPGPLTTSMAGSSSRLDAKASHHSRHPPLQRLADGAPARALRSPTIHSWVSSRKLRTQIGLLHETVLTPHDRKEIPLRLYLQILALDIAEAHHAPV